MGRRSTKSTGRLVYQTRNGLPSTRSTGRPVDGPPLRQYPAIFRTISQYPVMSRNISPYLAVSRRIWPYLAMYCHHYTTPHHTTLHHTTLHPGVSWHMSRYLATNNSGPSCVPPSPIHLLRWPRGRYRGLRGQHSQSTPSVSTLLRVLAFVYAAEMRIPLSGTPEGAADTLGFIYSDTSKVGAKTQP